MILSLIPPFSGEQHPGPGVSLARIVMSLGNMLEPKNGPLPLIVKLGACFANSDV